MAGQHVEEGRTIARMLGKAIGTQNYWIHARMSHPYGSAACKNRHPTDALCIRRAIRDGYLLKPALQVARVIASSLGGLPETNCGLLTLVEERNPQALQ